MVVSRGDIHELHERSGRYRGTLNLLPSTGGAGKLLAEDVSMASPPGFLADGKRIQYMAVGGVDTEDGDAPVVAMTTINTDNGSKAVLAVAQAKSGPGKSIVSEASPSPADEFITYVYQ